MSERQASDRKLTLADRKFERRMWVDLGNDEIPTLLDENTTFNAGVFLY